MKNTLLITIIAAVTTLTLAHAEPKPKVSIAPSQLYGKTFEECEKILGKPTKTEDAAGERRSFARCYKSPLPGVSQIKLERVPEGSMDGPVPTTVNFIWYSYPKGTIKTLGEAFSMIGASMEGASKTPLRLPPQLQHLNAHPVPIPETTATIGAESISISRLKDGLLATWMPSAGTMSMPPQYQNPDADTLSFQKER